MKPNQDYYQFIQKQTDTEDPKYQPYFTHTFEYIANILMLGNSLVLLLITLLKDNHKKLPSHGMLGSILKENKDFFLDKLDNEIINELFLFNQSLNQIKHSIIGVSETNITNPQIITFFDLKSLQSVTLSELDQQLNIRLGQKNITNLQSKQ
jgi:hypothetical protein